MTGADGGTGEGRRGDRRLRVLVVEDNAVNQRLTAFVLETMGHEHVTVSNGREAVEAVREEEFDLVLMDCQMPVMDGYQATEAIRALEVGRRTPILALTAQTLPGDRERCLACGMDGYLPKPFEPEALSAEMARLVASNSRSGARGRSSRPPPPVDDALLADDALDRLRVIARASPSAAEEVVELFLRDGRRVASELRSAAAGRDAAALRRLAHGILGSSSMVGAARVAALARAIQHAAKTADFPAAARAAAAMEPAIEETHRVFTRSLGASARGLPGA